MRRALALAALAALTACQDYQFSPVGRCLLHPGRVSVATMSAVDILFVVDDSLSMDEYQNNLASNLGTFINRLAQKQQDRVRSGREPFDIHIAVTSTSVLVNRYNQGTGGSEVVTRYYNFVNNDPRNCTPGVLKANGDPYPAGAFVAKGSNPKVISFTKNLNWSAGSSDPTIAGLIERFKENVKVGSCGANQEMPFAAAKLAIEKARDGDQDAAWLHDNAKLAIIFMGNEDDCSTKAATDGGLVWDSQASTDACRLDPGHQLTPWTDYRDFLVGLGRPVASAFVRPGYDDCTSKGLGPGTRMHDLADALNKVGNGTSASEASVCSSSFATALEAIADALPPPDHLTLKTTPAASEIMRLQVLQPDGSSVHVCEGPDSAKEWWFVDCSSNQALAPGAIGTCIQLKSAGGCEPQPGQVLVAEYMARVPSEGCSVDTDCSKALGGQAKDWTCHKASSSQTVGTCICKGG